MFRMKLFEILGYFGELYDGGYKWHGNAPDAELVAAVEGLPNNEIDFIAVDLTAYAAALQTYQCELIRQRRALAYQAAGITPEQYLNAQFDGTPSVADLEAMRAQVKADIPYPGAYR